MEAEKGGLPERFLPKLAIQIEQCARMEGRRLNAKAVEDMYNQ